MPDLTDAQWQEIEAHLFARRKVQAIKLYREYTRCDLKTAKDAMDEHAEELEKLSPEKFAAKAKGCGAGVLLMTLLFALTLITLKMMLE